MHRLMMVVGVIIVLFSAFIVASAIMDSIGGESDTETSVLVGLVVFFSLTGFGGLYLTVNSRKKGKRQAEQRMEREIFRVIAARGGRVTPFEIAAETDLSAGEAQAYMDKLCNDGMGELQVTSEGNLIYVFRGAASKSEKATAASPL